VHEGVEFLLTYMPSSLRIVISGRADPPIPLPRLRASGDLTEIRMHELSFSVPEAAQLVAGVGTVELDPYAVGGLCERTEGWAAGLQLAALALRSSSVQIGGAGIRGDDRHISDYFSSEVLERLTAACSLALALYDSGRFVEADQVCTQTAEAARSVEQAWGMQRHRGSLNCR
jgi:LuxR family maltose regulon positive regulatory protein